ncbi:MAG: acetate/propionate family kinase [Metamycoplasmataceae bacterium]
MEKSKILVVNAGSSSIKISLFDKNTYELIAKGTAEKITIQGGFINLKYNGKNYEKIVEMENHAIAVEELLQLIEEIKLIKNPKEIEYIGFRIVNGGPLFTKTTKLNEKVIEQIEDLSIYAPLHNPGAVKGIKGFMKVMPFAKMALEFDTSFHTTIPEINSLYPIPYQLSKKYHIKKYGAHGISHEYITLKLKELLKKEDLNYINMHIGNGASICAIKDSKSFDTSMGLTPLAGIMMGTRSGDVDPSIHQFLVKQLNIDIDEVTNILNKKSGLLGVSEISSDMREILFAYAKNDRKATLALNIYIQKIADYVSSYANKLDNKLDAIVFTAGVGENQPTIWKLLIEKLKFNYFELDDSKIALPYDDYKIISSKKSKVKVFVIRTNEELLIAKKTKELYEK